MYQPVIATRPGSSARITGAGGTSAPLCGQLRGPHCDVAGAAHAGATGATSMVRRLSAMLNV